MRHQGSGNVRSVLVISFVAATVGMVVDVCSGPLPPHDVLAMLLDLAGAAPALEDAPPDAGGLRGERQPPPSLVGVADWPVPVLAAKCRPHAKRRIALAPTAAAGKGARAAGPRAWSSDRLPTFHAPSLIHLCRLNC